MKKAKSKPKETFFDIIIAGGGYVGLSCAVAIKSAAPQLSIMIVDPAPEAALNRDERASAIAKAAYRMLTQLGVWEQLEADAQPINEMIITDSKLTDITRPVFLTFGSADEKDPGDGPFAYMVENRRMISALRERSDALGIVRHQEEGVSDFSIGPAGVDVLLNSGIKPRTGLLVACDGVRSKLRDIAGIKTVYWPYNQKGIVCTVEHERPHNGRAEEHFLPAGPFAILPLKGNKSSLVWTERTEDADRLVSLDRTVFELELEQRFGHKLGEIKLSGKVQAFPLGLRLAREYVRNRFVLAGDAAHGIHPIAGQGLNLGFKDAAALAETVVEAHRLGMDIGTLDVLERYQMWRRPDAVQMGIVTDILNRLFSNDNDLIRATRDFGLGVVERLPGLKGYFIAQASGDEAGSPRLLAGNAI